MTENKIRKIVKESIEESLGGWAKDKANKTWQSTKKVGKAIGRETKETAIAAKILYKLVKRKNPTPEEIKFLKGQSADLGKALALIGLQAIPGSSAVVIALEKVLKKYGMTLFPKKQEL